MRTTGKNGHRAPRFLEGLAMVLDLGGFLHPRPRALGDFSEDAAAVGRTGPRWERTSVTPGRPPCGAQANPQPPPQM